ncbi:MAG: hypothetical protein Q9209_006680 [Squamulea sp. 1 TL-2023]
MLKDEEEDLDMVPLSKMQSLQSLPSHSPPQSVCPKFQSQEPSISSQLALEPLPFVQLIDVSLRHALSGIAPPRKNLQRPGADASDIQLTHTTPSTSLADISPALFRPGYMKAISQRAPLIPLIASSISSIYSRSRTQHHTSTDVEIASTVPLIEVKSRNLQVQLWHLLQKRNWPTTALEPLNVDVINTLNRHKKGREIILDRDENDELPSEAEWGPKEDEDMLYPFMEMVEDDEDLFSSYERTPYSSQNTSLSYDEMILDSEEDGMMLGEDLLLSREDDGFRASLCQEDGALGCMQLREGLAYLEDPDFECLEDDDEDIEDRASMMLF